jgi:hypothetical protein
VARGAVDVTTPDGAAGATAHFKPGWREEWAGCPRASGALTVVYDRERAAECFGGHEREARLVVVAEAAFAPGGERREAKLVGGVARFIVPAGAREVSLWFRAVNGDGGTSWDTCFGRNYRHPIEPA